MPVAASALSGAAQSLTVAEPPHPAAGLTGSGPATDRDRSRPADCIRPAAYSRWRTNSGTGRSHRNADQTPEIAFTISHRFILRIAFIQLGLEKGIQ